MVAAVGAVMRAVALAMSRLRLSISACLTWTCAVTSGVLGRAAVAGQARIGRRGSRDCRGGTATVTVGVSAKSKAPSASPSAVRRAQSSEERAASSGKRSTISAATGAVGVAVARGVTEESEEESVFLLPARLGVLEGAGFFLWGGVLEGFMQVEEEVWRHLLSWEERMVLGRMVVCNMPPRSWVGVPMREALQSAQVMCEPKGTGTRGGEGHVLGRWTQDPSTARVASSERVP